MFQRRGMLRSLILFVLCATIVTSAVVFHQPKAEARMITSLGGGRISVQLGDRIMSQIARLSNFNLNLGTSEGQIFIDDRSIKLAQNTLSAESNSIISFPSPLIQNGAISVSLNRNQSEHQPADPTQNQPAPTEQSPSPEHDSNTPSSFFVSLDFDDGYDDAYDQAAPILNNANLKGTFYVITGFVGFSGYMNEQQIKNLSSSGHEIGAHTRHHPHLTQIPQEQLEDEIAGSKQDLEAMGLQVNSFAYPFGEFNNQVKNVVQQSGFASARTSQDGFNHPGIDPFLLKVFTLTNDTDLNQVKSWISRAKEENQWLILVFHNIEERGDTYSTTPEMFQQIANYLSNEEIPVLTVTEGMQKLGIN